MNLKSWIRTSSVVVWLNYVYLLVEHKEDLLQPCESAHVVISFPRWDTQKWMISTYTNYFKPESGSFHIIYPTMSLQLLHLESKIDPQIIVDQDLKHMDAIHVNPNTSPNWYQFMLLKSCPYSWWKKSG